jgi:outer membrane protein OmpA-like peptidoglycan-associated protein
MADLNVQPKKNSMLPWILLGLGIIAILFFLLKGNKTSVTKDNAVINNDSIKTNTMAAADGWDKLNNNAPAATYEEITNRDIEVRSDDNYTIYSLGENILFDADKSSLKTNAVQNLKQITASIDKRYSKGEVRVYGFTDATGNEQSNKELAQQRAASVKNWLIENGNISESRISAYSMGEANPAEPNATSQGREQNRRVEIIVKRT